VTPPANGTVSTPISRDDIEAKFREVQGEVNAIETEAFDYLGLAVAAVAVTVVVVAFVLGSRRGRKRRTVVEIRRV
jgi:H+/gluconate symporter-like permease